MSGDDTPRLALFDTAIGRCGIAWTDRGVACVQLPEGSDASTRARLISRCRGAQPGNPPAHAQHAIDGMTKLLQGERIDLADVTLDMASVPDFHRRVYEITRSIPPGETLAYGDIAGRLGLPGSARAVGQALGRNPFPIIVPCHRVLAAGGRMGGFSAHGGTDTKLRLLDIERAVPARLF